MRAVATDFARSVVCLSVSLSVCVLVTPVSRAKTAEPIEMLFKMYKKSVGRRNHVLYGGTYGHHLSEVICTRRRCGLLLT